MCTIDPIGLLILLGIVIMLVGLNAITNLHEENKQFKKILEEERKTNEYLKTIIEEENQNENCRNFKK